jgi:hypothetical protein
MATLSDAWKALWNDPLGALGEIFSPGVAVDGKPTFSGGPLNYGFGQPVDSIVSAQQRAYGVDPFTGDLIAPQYATAAANAGRDPANPQAFLDRVRTDTLNFYNRQLALNSADSPGGSSASWLLSALVILVLLFVLLKAVK